MNQRIAAIIGVLLLVIIGAQSFYIVRLSNRVDQLGQHSSTGNDPLNSTQPNTDPFASRDMKGWDPFEQMQRMQNEVNKMFGDMRSQMHQSPGFGDITKPFSFSPSVDMKEEHDRFVVTADIPGADESNINVSLEDSRLTISAKTKKSTENKGGVLRSERFIGKFERSIMLPSAVVAEKMTTDYKDGVLTIVLPKA